MIRAALALVLLAMGVTTAIAQDDWISPAGRDHPLAGKIWDVAQGAFVTETALLGKLAGHQFVLLGETHTNEDHHRLQARIVAGLAATGGFEAVAFESSINPRPRPWPGTWIRMRPRKSWPRGWAGR
jgi:uncharacterized iron-regulated protein